MSDSRRVLGDCRHAQTPEWCVTCLCEKIARLEADNKDLRDRNQIGGQMQERAEELAAENQRLNAIIDAPVTALFCPDRLPTQNERHLLNLISWRQKEAAEAKDESARLRAGLEMLAQIRHVSGNAQAAFRHNLRVIDAILAGKDMRKIEDVESLT